MAVQPVQQPQAARHLVTVSGDIVEPVAIAKLPESWVSMVMLEFRDRDPIEVATVDYTQSGWSAF